MQNKDLTPEQKQIAADAIREFVYTIGGAYYSNFVQTPYLNIWQLHRCAEDLVLDTYGVTITPLTPDEVSEIKESARHSITFDGVKNLVEMCHGDAKKAGWHDNPREVGTMLALIHSEVSEAMEGFRKDLNDDHLPHRKMAEVELADAVIRICDLAGLYEFDLAGAIAEKLEYNRTRADHKKENREKEGGKKF